MHFGRFLAPFRLHVGPFWLPFGSRLVSLDSLLVPFDSLLVTLALDVLTFGASWRHFSYFYVFSMKSYVKSHFLESPSCCVFIMQSIFRHSFSGTRMYVPKSEALTVDLWPLCLRGCSISSALVQNNPQEFLTSRFPFSKARCGYIAVRN